MCIFEGNYCNVRVGCVELEGDPYMCNPWARDRLDTILGEFIDFMYCKVL